MDAGRDPKNFLKLIESPGSVQDYFLFKLEGEEKLSSPFEFRLTIRSQGDIPQASQWVGASITFIMGVSDDSPRKVNGQCVRFEHAYQKGQYVEFVLDISASLSSTKLNQDNRIFTAKTAKQVVGQILGEHDIAFDNTKVKSVTRVREYCTQYGESDFDFISRLMQEEGVFYYFRYDEDAGRFKHKMILADDPSGFFDGDPQKVTFRASPLHPGLKSVGTSYAASTGGWLTNDYDFKKPTALTPVKTASRLDYSAKSTRQYVWPANGYAPDDVRRASKLAIEHQESGALAVQGQGKYVAFTPGARFEIDDPRLSLRERRIAVRTVSHSAFDPWGLEEGEPHYEQTFSAVPSDQPHRPERSTPAATVRGPQTGVVVDQVDPEGFGRIQVRFHWDHAGVSTCWLRVAQQWAGGKIGAQFVPRPGMEVLVDYLEGDPRPADRGGLHLQRRQQAALRHPRKPEPGRLAHDEPPLRLDRQRVHLRGQGRRRGDLHLRRAQPAPHHGEGRDRQHRAEQRAAGHRQQRPRGRRHPRGARQGRAHHQLRHLHHPVGGGQPGLHNSGGRDHHRAHDRPQLMLRAGCDPRLGRACHRAGGRSIVAAGGDGRGAR